ncbi:MAG: Cof-type HAD-IIB family hydrolase [Lachnospiraceae bacterium]|nr:Cof-type HAD-IIB family hydrolase [Lachnospiraceae bacterium]
MTELRNEEKKIFFSDLDGTLLTSDKRISARTKKALDDFVLRGNHFAICTGRGLDNVLDVSRNLEVDYPGSFLICYNGALIYDHDKEEVIFRVGVPLEMIPGIFEMAASHHVHAHTYTADSLVTPDNGEEMQYYNRVIKRPLIVTDDITGNLPEEPCKVIAIELHDLQKLERFRQAVMEKYGDRVTTVYSNPYYLEIFMKEAGKGSAVKRLSEYLGIPIAGTIAAGDEQNDISMIEEAGLGIAMANAGEEVKRAANAVTETDNDHDGLAPFLELRDL